MRSDHRDEVDLLERGRAESIEAVSLPRVDHGQLSRHGQYCTLACSVSKLRCCGTNECDNACSVDDTGLLLAMLPETQDCVLAAEPHALNIDRLRKIPDLLRRVNSVSIVSVHDASVVENYIYTTPGVKVLDHGFDVGFLRDIGDFGLKLLGVWHYGLELLQGFVQSRSGDVGEENVGTLAGKEDACFQTNTTVMTLVQQEETCLGVDMERVQREDLVCTSKGFVSEQYRDRDMSHEEYRRILMQYHVIVALC